MSWIELNSLIKDILLLKDFGLGMIAANWNFFSLGVKNTFTFFKSSWELPRLGTLSWSGVRRTFNVPRKEHGCREHEIAKWSISSSCFHWDFSLKHIFWVVFWAALLHLLFPITALLSSKPQLLKGKKRQVPHWYILPLRNRKEDPFWPPVDVVLERVGAERKELVKFS